MMDTVAAVKDEVEEEEACTAPPGAKFSNALEDMCKYVCALCKVSVGTMCYEFVMDQYKLPKSGCFLMWEFLSGGKIGFY